MSDKTGQAVTIGLWARLERVTDATGTQHRYFTRRQGARLILGGDWRFYRKSD